MDSTEFKKGITDAKSSVGDFQKNIGGMGSSLKALAGVAGVTLGVAGLVGFLRDCVKSAGESEKAMAQTEAVIKSTGGSAGMTAKAVGELAKQLQSQTAFSDEAIQSAENLLLTFTNIKDDVFPQATQTVLDMSTALGQDLQSSSVQLGKALQDPIEGITALKRVGVNFTDSQKKMIEELVNTNRGMEAQKMILSELNKEFGGSAAEYAKTYAGRMENLANRFDDLKELIGQAVIPIIQELAGNVGDNISVFMIFVDAIRVVSDALNGLMLIGNIVGSVLSGLGAVILLALRGDFESIGNVWKGVTDDMLASATKSADRSAMIWGKATDKIGSTGKKLNLDLEKSNSQKTAKMKKDLEEETSKFERETKKRLAMFNESLRDMVLAHLESKKSIEKDMADENKDFSENMSDREDDQKETLGTMESDHNDKVATIQEQIDIETAKGLDADATKLQSFIDELAKEDEQYTLKVAKQEEKYKKENERLKADHDEKIASYQTELDKENEILSKHSEDVAKFKDAVVEDDISRLKRQFAEEEAIRLEDHNKRLAELYAQGVAETEAYNAGKSGKTGSNVVTDIKNKVNDATKNTPITVPAPIITPSPVGGDTSATPRGNGGSLLGTIGEAVKNAWSWLTDRLPKFDAGGVVGGAIGSSQLIMAHGGETILPTHKGEITLGGGQKQTIVNQYITNNVQDSSDVGTINERLAFMLRNSNL